LYSVIYKLIKLTITVILNYIRKEHKKLENSYSGGGPPEYELGHSASKTTAHPTLLALIWNTNLTILRIDFVYSYCYNQCNALI
jgi:hypothetical protein